jgi:hypothetical protein
MASLARKLGGSKRYMEDAAGVLGMLTLILMAFI